MSEDKWKEKYTQFKALQEHIEQISEHLEKVQNARGEIANSKQAIEDFGRTAVDSQVLAPIANGIFVKGKVADTTTFLVNVGADTVVEKTAEQVTELLEKQEKEMGDKAAQMEQLLEVFQSQAMKIVQEVEEGQ